MVGSAIVRELQRQGYTNIITRTHKELDLTRQEAVERFFEEEKPDVVVNFAAESHVDRSIEDPGVFLRTNVMGTQVLLDACRRYGLLCSVQGAERSGSHGAF